MLESDDLHDVLNYQLNMISREDRDAGQVGALIRMEMRQGMLRVVGIPDGSIGMKFLSEKRVNLMNDILSNKSDGEYKK